jgi:negative regulator of genetic competence, sporulation and motility
LGGFELLIESHGNKKIMIRLSSQDMRIYNIDFNDLDFTGEKTRRLIDEWLTLAGDNIADFKENTPILVEALKLTSGCMVRITILNNSYKDKRYKIQEIKKMPLEDYKNPRIYMFEEIEDVLAVIKKLYGIARNLPTKLYIMDGSYYLLIVTSRLPKYLYGLLNDYGSYLGKRNLLKANMVEYGEPVTGFHAVKEIGVYLDS